MKIRIVLMLLLAILTFSCNESSFDGYEIVEKSNNENRSWATLSIQQAKLYASLFSSYLDEKDILPDSNGTTRAKTEVPKELDEIDCYVENGDTLLYAINYKNEGGYIIIATSNQSFPILAHSNRGSLKFNRIDEGSALNLFIDTYIRRVKDGHDSNFYSSEYYDNWKDLGKSGYEYEIILNNDEPIAQTRGRRQNSSGKTIIYPHTGKSLDAWCQRGGYNYYSPNQVCIGCPALSIGMLLFDTSQRVTGNFTKTFPSFDYNNDVSDISSYTTGTETAKKLRQIADSIPNYQWGTISYPESGAHPDDIVIGLRKLGYKNAKKVNYDFETLYNNLNFKGFNFLGEEATLNRGVLIGAFSQNGGGHIWFCDGYYEQSYICRKKFLGITISTWTEYDDRVYMNWGWGVNQGNGWYCATDDIWTSLEGNPDVYLKVEPVIYVNLNHYENSGNN